MGAEDGMGLMLVLGIGALIMALGATALLIFSSASTGSTRQVQRENAVHVAEHGVDRTLSFVQKSANHDWSNRTIGDPTIDTTDEVDAWASAQLAAASATEVVKTPDGEWFAIRPSERNVIYTRSWVPSKANPKWSRTLKVEYLLSAINPAQALLVDGDLQLGGASGVGGIGGHVHANGTIEFSGSASVTGTVGATGAINVTGSPTAGGGLVPGTSAVKVDSLNPRDYWRANHALSELAWYDLCGNGEIRLPNGATPCTGTLAPGFVLGTDYLHWSFNSVSKLWSYNSDDPSVEGVFYAHQANIKVTGSPGNPTNPWNATLLAETEPSPAEPGCAGTRAYGDISTQGSPSIRAYHGDVVFMAGRDLDVGGTVGNSYEGAFGAVEQIKFTGNPTFTGAVLVADFCDTPGSPISQNYVSGTMTITYEKDLEIPTGTVIRTVLWQEIQAT